MRSAVHASTHGCRISVTSCYTFGLVTRSWLCQRPRQRQIRSDVIHSGRCCAFAGNAGSKADSRNGTKLVKDSRLDSTPALISSAPSFFARLLATSLAGSLLVKYGSLLIDLPFMPSAPAALALIFGPTAVFSIILLAKSQGSQGH